ncbi:unnamed protein product, partial [Nesidiocoris tenuis]
MSAFPPADEAAASAFWRPFRAPTGLWVKSRRQQDGAAEAAGRLIRRVSRETALPLLPGIEPVLPSRGFPPQIWGFLW